MDEDEDNEFKNPPEHFICKSCGSVILGLEPTGGICHKCLTDDDRFRNPKKDISIMHRIPSEVITELDRIAGETNTKRSKIIDRAIKEFIEKHNQNRRFIRVCSECNKMFRSSNPNNNICPGCIGNDNEINGHR